MPVTPQPSAGPIARNVVARPRLLDALDAALDRPVSLVCAPAGYGKTLTVASWVADRCAGEAAWADVGVAGDSAGVLWETVVRALGRTVPDGPSELRELAVLAGRAPEEVPARLARWMREREHRTVLVLDDLHAVTSAPAHEQLVELVAAASTAVHLVVVSRHDPPWPLARMRLDGLVAEVRMDALSFTVPEAAEMLAGLGLSVPDADVPVLVDRTEGWAAGLRLAALGAANSADPRDFVDSVSGSEGYIADYLLREVYHALPEPWRRFLVRISVVDEVCADLAAAMGGDSTSAEMLAEMARQNAFVHEIQHRAGWYRVHPLLADFLQTRNTDAALRLELHHSAASWYAAQGRPVPALGHALAAEDWAMAGDLVSTNVVSWAVRKPPHDLIATLRALPHEAVLGDPGLALGLAAARAMAGMGDGVPDLVEVATSQIDRVPGRRRRRLQFLVDLVAVGTLRWTGDLDGVLAQCRRLPTQPGALSAMGMSDWATIRILLINNTGTCEMWTGDLEGAREHLEQAVSEAAGLRTDLPVLNALAHLSYLYWERGDLARAETTALEAVEAFGAIGAPVAVQAATAFLALSGVALDRGETVDARTWLEEATPAFVEPHTALAAGMASALILRAEGHPYDALVAGRSALEAVEGRPVPPHLVAQARWVLESLHGPAGSGDDGDLAGRRWSVAASLHGVREIVDRSLHRAADPTRPQEERLDALEAALAAAAPELLRRPFLDRAETLEQLLALRIEQGTACTEFAVDLRDRMSPARTDASRRALYVSLTEREMNVLHYLSTSMAATEIAAALYVSVNTVKTHQRSIYRKLGATGRREAVEHARRLDLL